METTTKTAITVKTLVNAPIDKVWKCWTTSGDIIKWNFASDDWHTPKAHNNLQESGRFVYRMEAKDGSFGFDFSGVYNIVVVNKLIEYTLDDGRKTVITFNALDNKTQITETFEAESINPIELQQNGWQAILNNFKKYVEEN